MPIIHPGDKVLVTGATGFVATWVIQTLLERGFRVRGTVRSESKGRELQVIFHTFGENFEFVVVEDMEKEGAFDDAVKGVDAVEHVASPAKPIADDPQELIGPAVQGTIGVLCSVIKHGLSVKRVVITSSAATLPRVPTFPEVAMKITESDWNDVSPNLVEELGRDASGFDKYRTSKVLAEKAAWKFAKERKGSIGWDLVTLVPPWVFGVADPSNLNYSCRCFYNVITHQAALAEMSDNGHYVDVRDLAEAHVVSLVREEARGQRFIISAGVWTWQHFVDALVDSDQSSFLPNLPKEIPGAGRSMKFLLDYDSSKAKQFLGVNFRSLEETARDCVQAFKERGWLG